MLEQSAKVGVADSFQGIFNFNAGKSNHQNEINLRLNDLCHPFC